VDLLFEPQAWLIIIVLTTLGVVGNLAWFELGKQGTKEITARFPRIKTEAWERIQGLCEEYRARVLILSAISVLASLVTTTAGAMGIRRPVFLVWVTFAKLLRNWLLVVALYEPYLLLSR
jgi:membrane protein YqaA with SNARE-associated domain